MQLGVDYLGQTVDAAKFARVPNGSGASLTYDPLPGGLLPPKAVAILFLNQYTKDTPYKYAFQKNCPPGIPTVAEMAPATGTDVDKAFRIWTSAPTAAYDFMPFGGGASAITSASLLLPTASWAKSYVMVAGYGVSPASDNPGSFDKLWPWSAVVASEDDTKIVIVPKTRNGQRPSRCFPALSSRHSRSHTACATSCPTGPRIFATHLPVIVSTQPERRRSISPDCSSRLSSASLASCIDE